MAKEEPDFPAPSAPTSDAVNTAVRHRVYLERVSSHISEKVRDKALRVGKATTKRIAETGGELTELSPKGLSALLAESQSANIDLLTEAISELTIQLEDLSMYEQEFSARALSAITRKVKVKTLKAGEAYAEAIANPIGATGELLEDFTKEWPRRQAKAVSDLVAKGYANGLTNQQIITSIRGTKAANYADGIMPRIGSSADAVVRTSVQHVAGTARELMYAKNSDIVVGRRIVGTLEGGKWNCGCRALDGRVFKLGEGPRLPLHPNCKCADVPEVASEFAFLDEGTTRASVNGSVDGNLTYYAWLKQQPVAFQEDAIGVARATLLRDGGLSADEFARLNLGRNFQPLTLDQMRKKEPNAFERAGL